MIFGILHQLAEYRQAFLVFIALHRGGHRSRSDKVMVERTVDVSHTASLHPYARDKETIVGSTIFWKAYVVL